jgi:Tol biopolymer transport system component
MSGAEPWPHLLVFDLAREVLGTLTSRGSETSRYELNPVWTPDGERLGFATGGASYVFQPHWALADGSGPMELLHKSEINEFPYDWTPDGETLVFVELTAEQGTNIGLFSRQGTPESQVLLSSEANEDEPSLSPDGRWLAYTSDESGRREVYVQPFPDLGAKWKISADGGWSPRWSREGRELFYRDGTHLMAVGVETAEDFTATRPEPLFEDSAPPWLDGGYDVSPDGQRFLMMEVEEEGAKEIVIILDWFDELERLVPAQ